MDGGKVFATFTGQDSGCVAFGVELDGRRLFVKAPAMPSAVPSLRRAMALHAAVAHPAIIPLLKTLDTDAGPALVYPWVDGDLLYVERDRRLDPDAPGPLPGPARGPCHRRPGRHLRRPPRHRRRRLRVGRPLRRLLHLRLRRPSRPHL